MYTAWVDAYSCATDGVRFNYQSIGSGASVEQFTQRIIDFGASDSAMSNEQIARIKGGALVLPMTAGEFVLVYNLPGIEEVRLPRDVSPAIYTGEITRWNDERIAAANPDVDLPDMEIRVIVRSDS
ncbi:MAG: substrate-binding domain-containing protein [Geminicoccaceae bacterium]